MELDDPEIKDLLQGFVAIKVDLTDQTSSNPAQGVFAKYGGEFIPDIRILSADGKEIARPETTRAGVREALKRALGK